MLAERAITSTLTDLLGHYLYIVGAVLCALALIYSALVLVAIRFRPRVTAVSESGAPVTILKPLCGPEARLYESLRSFCVLDYPRYQIVFGVVDPKDPAVQVVDTLRCEFPDLDVCLVVSGARHGSNPKVSNLINMVPAARHEYLVIADSDIIVEPDYLQRLVPHLEDSNVGIVTCAYVGDSVGGPWSKIGAEFINGWFTPSVFVAALFKSRAFAFGATIGLRRDVLESVGGFGALADQLADDYRLGELTRRLGLRTVLSEVIVATTVGERTLADLIDHELRWLRTIRCLRPVGYALAGLSYSVPVAVIGALLAWGRAGSLWLLLATLACRAALFYAGSPAARRGVRSLPLAVAADCLLFALWCGSFLSHRVRWRHARFDVSPDGTAVPAHASSFALSEASPVEHAISNGELS